VTLRELPVAPLSFDESCGDDEAEWWRVCRDAYERLGWGFTKSAKTANTAAADANVQISRTRRTVANRAKAEGWEKAPISARTTDEKRSQTAAARHAASTAWRDRRRAMASEAGSIAEAASHELLEYFRTPLHERTTSTTKGDTTAYDDGSATALRTAKIAAIAIDKADQLSEGIEEHDHDASDQETRADKYKRLEPLLGKVIEAMEDSSNGRYPEA